jgi:hypothetical protein
MTGPETLIVALAVIEALAVAAMGIAGFLMYRRVQEVSGWIKPAIHESKAIAARGKATALGTKERVMTFYGTPKALVQLVGRKMQTTTRLAREVVRPDLKPLHETARALTGPDGLAARIARLHQASKIGAGQGNGTRR